jgi:hypothetical protein
MTTRPHNHLDILIPFWSLFFATGVLLREAVGVSTAGVIVDVDAERENGLPTPRCVPLSSCDLSALFLSS